MVSDTLKITEILPFDPLEAILLPENHTHPNLVISTYLLRNSSLIQRRAQELGLEIEETGRYSDNTPFIGNLSHQTLMALNTGLVSHSQVHSFTPGLNELAEFLYEIILCSEGKKPIYDGYGNQIETRKAKRIRQNVLRPNKKDHNHGESLNILFNPAPLGILFFYQKFDERNICLAIEEISRDSLMKTNIRPVTSETKDLAIIDFEAYLATYRTAQGLPRYDIPIGTESNHLVYDIPQENCFARFFVGSSTSNSVPYTYRLSCHMGNEYLHPNAGVRPALMLAQGTTLEQVVEQLKDEKTKSD